MSSELDRFVRVPTDLLDALLLVRISGVQWQIVLWVIRQTYGWHRRSAPFTWYRIAKELSLDRGGVVRAGRKLLKQGVLFKNGDTIGSNTDSGAMTSIIELRLSDDKCQRRHVSADEKHLKAMTERIESDDKRQRKRCQASSLSRRAKERCKEREREKETRPGGNDHRKRRTMVTKSDLSLPVTAPANSVAPPAEHCEGCQKNVAWEWCSPVRVAGRVLAGTGGWRSQLLDDCCPDCFVGPRL